MRKSTAFLTFLALAAVLAFLSGIHASWARARTNESVEAKARLVEELALTDLCLFTEANYTRHPSQADWHTPFGDGPFTLDHFPSGGLMAPPDGLREPDENLD